MGVRFLTYAALQHVQDGYSAAGLPEPARPFHHGWCQALRFPDTKQKKGSLMTTLSTSKNTLQFAHTPSRLRKFFARAGQRYMLAREFSALSQLPYHTIARPEIDRRMGELRALLREF